MSTPLSLPAPIAVIAVTHSGPSCPVLRTGWLGFPVRAKFAQAVAIVLAS